MAYRRLKKADITTVAHTDRLTNLISQNARAMPAADHCDTVLEPNGQLTSTTHAIHHLPHSRIMTTLPHTPLIILGAGFSGIGTAIQAERLVSVSSYEIYEKSSSLGATWSANLSARD